VKYGLFLFILVFVSLKAEARMPTNPYFFRTSQFNDLLPFTLAQSDTFRVHKIKKVIEEGGEYKTVYYLNEKGQVYFQRMYYTYKKKTTLSDSGYYSYNNSGKPVSVRRYGHSESFDTIAYDDKGRVIYSLSYDMYFAGKKKPKNKSMNGEWKLLKIQGDETFLEEVNDSSGHEIIVLDLSNEIVRNIADGAVTDSIARIAGPNGNYSLYYYFVSVSNKSFKIGMKKNFENGKLKSEIQYETYSPEDEVARRDFIYGGSGKLLQIVDSRGSKKIFYGYDDRGFQDVVIDNYRETADVTRYYYHYR
jgi:hypothetical protein